MVFLFNDCSGILHRFTKLDTNSLYEKECEIFLFQTSFSIHFRYLKILCAKRVLGSFLSHLVAVVEMVSITFFIDIKKISNT